MCDEYLKGDCSGMLKIFGLLLNCDNIGVVSFDCRIY